MSADIKTVLTREKLLSMAMKFRQKPGKLGASYFDVNGFIEAIEAAVLSASAPAQEPVGEVIMVAGFYKEVAWKEGKLPAVATKLYAAPVDAQDAVDAKRLQISIMELEVERKKNQHFLDMLVSISSLTVGPDVTVGDKKYRFNPPNAAEILHELSARIRAIPGKIAALQASQSPQDQVKP